MRALLTIAAAGCLLALAANAHGPARPLGGGREAGTVDSFVARLMAFDADSDGSLTLKELSDERLRHLFERADMDHDGVLTRTELTSLYAKENIAQADRGGPGGDRGGPPPGGRRGSMRPGGGQENSPGRGG